MSAGNYGKSFAFASKHYGTKGKVVMPETAPESRSVLIQVRAHLTVKYSGTGYLFLEIRSFGGASTSRPQSFGVEVERVPTSCLMNVVNRCVQEDNMTFLHSYDDLDLITGHAR